MSLKSAIEELKQIDTGSVVYKERINDRLEIWAFKPGLPGNFRSAEISDYLLYGDKIDLEKLFMDYSFENGTPHIEKSIFMKAVEEGGLLVIQGIDHCSDAVISCIDYVAHNDEIQVSTETFKIYDTPTIKVNPDFRMIVTICNF